MCSASCLLSAVCYVSSTASTSPKQNNNKMQNNKMQNNKKQKQEKREGASNSRFTSATQSSQRRGRHTASATPKDASPARPASPYSAFERMSFSRCASWNTRSTCSVWFWFCLFCVCVCVCVLGEGLNTRFESMQTNACRHDTAQAQAQAQAQALAQAQMQG